MSAKVLLVVAGLSVLGVVGCTQSQKNEHYDKTHDMRDDHVSKSMSEPADKPSTRPGMPQNGM
jgi:hypothetical protein